jgi:hypothetical protein
MEHWLIADITFLDVHLQLCMLLVTGITSLWFVSFGRPVAFAPPMEGNCIAVTAGSQRKEYRNERIRPADGQLVRAGGFSAITPF